MNKSNIFSVGAILALAACAHEGAPAADNDAGGRDAASALVARGNEPGWRVTLGADMTDFVLDYGERRFSAPTPPPTAADQGAVYRYGDVDATLTISDTLCEDDATGTPHPKTARLEEGGRVLNGCAGEPQSLLVGGEWVVEDIGGGGVIDFARTSLTFEGAGRASGLGACNHFSGSYELTGEGLSFGPLAATEKACPPAVMDQETRFFGALAATDRFEMDETGALILIGADKPLLRARR
ncbi:MAG: META domain-containing protein [Parvularculaceae bacterium]|nr:META domain-containing protein [Parvularculaceae bacterium]